jgi:hypothetical protein
VAHEPLGRFDVSGLFVDPRAERVAKMCGVMCLVIPAFLAAVKMRSRCESGIRDRSRPRLPGNTHSLVAVSFQMRRAAAIDGINSVVAEAALFFGVPAKLRRTV